MSKATEPGKLGPLTLRNRLIAEPMMSNSDVSGYVSKIMLDIYRERGAGQWGLVITEASPIRRDSLPFEAPGIYDDEFLPGLTKLADAIHQGGSGACIQILHAGRQANPYVSRTLVVGPSDNTPPWAGRRVRGLSTSEVEGIVESYAQAALRAKRAGFDAIMYHGSHGFLPQQFMSPWSNPDRTDRFRHPPQFAMEVIRRTRQVAGNDLALIMRMPAEEFRGDAGLNLRLVRDVIAPALENAGIDAIDLTTGNWHHFDAIVPPLYTQRATFVPYAEEVKKVLKTAAVVGVGRICDPKLADALIEQGRVDFVGIGRLAYADPHTPKKMMEGRYGEVRKCLGCDACFSARLPRMGIICAVNPRLQRSDQLPMTKVDKPRKVLVVGGGPAGMEAALTAAKRGHDVTLMEKTDKLGGQVNVSANIPRIYTRDLSNHIAQQEGWLKESGVRIVMGKEVTIDTVREMKPEYVILATGSKSLVPDIPGIDRPNVMFEEDAIVNQSKVGKKVVILGAARGAEMSISLVNGGREVTILEEGGAGNFVAAPYIFGQRPLVLLRLMRNPNLKLVPEVKVKEITAEGVTYVDKSGNESRVEADTVIAAVGRVSIQELEKPILMTIPEVREVLVVGDASRMKNQLNAIHDGFFAAYSIGDPEGLEKGRLFQILRLSAEQTRLPSQGLDIEVEWPKMVALPHIVPGLELRRSTRLASEAAEKGAD